MNLVVIPLLPSKEVYSIIQKIGKDHLFIVLGLSDKNNYSEILSLLTILNTKAYIVGDYKSHVDNRVIGIINEKLKLHINGKELIILNKGMIEGSPDYVFSMAAPIFVPFNNSDRDKSTDMYYAYESYRSKPMVWITNTLHRTLRTIEGSTFIGLNEYPYILELN